MINYRKVKKAKENKDISNFDSLRNVHKIEDTEITRNIVKYLD